MKKRDHNTIGTITFSKYRGTSSKMNLIYCKRLNDDAVLPTRATAHSAGFDLYSPMNMTLRSGEYAMIRLGISIELPVGVYGRIAPRSGLALRNGVGVLGGVVDSDYRGEVCVILICHDLHKDVEIKKGDRIAQLIPEKYLSDSQMIEVSKLDLTDRGEGGFGSTGN